MKLSKTKRVGIILSFIWVISAVCLELRHQTTAAQLRFDSSMNMCASENPIITLECKKYIIQDYELIFKKDWESVGAVSIFSILTIPIGWLIGFIAIRLWRWIKAGT
jgi:hypothetical protein